MNFNKHSDLVGLHAILSPSKYHWVGYDEEKLVSLYRSYQAIENGNKLHAFAAMSIELGRKQPKNKDILNTYINDAIGYRMTPEQPLFYSPNAFGTADAISFKEKERMLRVHDLKTGVTRVSMKQLEIYAAFFCLEYRIDPRNIQIELRIYQSEIFVANPDPDSICELMEKVIQFDKIITKLRMEEQSV